MGDSSGYKSKQLKKDDLRMVLTRMVGPPLPRGHTGYRGAITFRPSFGFRGGLVFRFGFRGGLVFKAHRLLYHSILGLRVIKKKKRSFGFMVGVSGLCSPEWWGRLCRAATQGTAAQSRSAPAGCTINDFRTECRVNHGLVFEAHRLLYHSA